MTPTLRAAADLRRAFLDFFVSKDHVEVPSSPLVPNDPTLLFTTAGMVQFKPYYTAGDDVPYTRATSVQKSLRLTDLDNVGLTPRHDTFFEMLGNFSFGPKAKGAYFKEEAIAYAWEFVTKTLGLPQERLYASVFEGEGNLPRDDEAVALWKKMGVPESRIVFLGRKDNFWGPAGGRGACGPCSEIYFDLGEKRPDYLAEGQFWGEAPGDPGDRYMEFWNLVFPQFDAQADGTLTPLARPGIDTGMGLERLALILQGKDTIFETDLFEPLVEVVLKSFKSGSRQSRECVRDARLVADHMRAVTFAAAEGVPFSNEGAGYVLRRIFRRAFVRAYKNADAAFKEPAVILPFVAREVVDHYGSFYPEMERRRELIMKAMAREAVLFFATYRAGADRLESLLRKSNRVGGEDAFALHDTYGFPVELTEEIVQQAGGSLDREGFERAMDEQRERARAASKFAKGGGEESAAWTPVGEGADSEFHGYTALSLDGLHVRRWRARGEELELVLDRTPCYAESGGQVADRGTLEGDGARATLTHVYKEGDAIVHRVKLAAGTRDALLAAGAAGHLRAVVDAAHRRPTLRHHTATHLLHAALRRTLGDHVRQAGSLVAPDRLRFDYHHFEAPSHEQLATVEAYVNDWVLRNRPVSWKVMPIAEAKAMGAMALFGEKYGAEVRMVTVEGVEDASIAPSRELCGGTHVERTGDIGAFVVVSEGAIAAGIRRIEALCGAEALRWAREEHETLHRAAAALQVTPAAVPEQVEKLRGELAALKKAASDAQRGGLEAEMERIAQGATAAPKGRWAVAAIGSEADANAVRDAADRLRGTLQSGAAVLALRAGEKLTFVAAVTDDLVAAKTLNASDLVKTVAKVAGGSGGGKPHLALAGAKEPDKMEAALDEARRLLQTALGA